jgi:hypothetical protein
VSEQNIVANSNTSSNNVEVNEMKPLQHTDINKETPCRQDCTVSSIEMKKRTVFSVEEKLFLARHHHKYNGTWNDSLDHIIHDLGNKFSK